MQPTPINATKAAHKQNSVRVIVGRIRRGDRGGRRQRRSGKQRSEIFNRLNRPTKSKPSLFLSLPRQGEKSTNPPPKTASIRRPCRIPPARVPRTCHSHRYSGQTHCSAALLSRPLSKSPPGLPPQPAPHPHPSERSPGRHTLPLPLATPPIIDPPYLGTAQFLTKSPLQVAPPPLCQSAPN